MRLPGRGFRFSCLPETAGGAALLLTPVTRNRWPGPSSSRGPASDRLRAEGLGGPASSRGERRPGRPSTCIARWPSVGATDRNEGPCHRRRGIHRIAYLRPALARGHEVVVLDALTPPVHRGVVPAYLSPEVDFYEGDVRDRGLVAKPPASGRRRLPLRRLPGLPARFFAILRRERGLDGLALRDHRRRASRPGPGRGGVIAGGDGRRALPVPDPRRAVSGNAA